MNLKLSIALLAITIVSVSSHPDADGIIEEDHGKTAQKGGTSDSFLGGSATRKLTAAAFGLLMACGSAMAHAARLAPEPDAGFGPGPVQLVGGLWQAPQHAPAPMYPGGPGHTELERQYLRQLGISELPHSRAYALQQHRHHKKLQESEGEQHKMGKSSRRRKTGKRRVLTDLPPLQGDLAVHDPTLVYAFGKWVLYSSHNGIEERESDDLITWVRPASDNAAFKNHPAWIAASSDIISPDVSGPYSDGLFRMYYAVPDTKSGHEPMSAIGMATSSSGRPGSWLDHGMILTSKKSDSYHAMDPNLFVDKGTGRWWLTFGAAEKGIFQVELDPKTGMPLDGAMPTNIAKGPNGVGAESPSLIEKDGWYYLFISFGSHDDTSSTNTIRYGYSKSPQGPFTDRNYMPMTVGYGTLLYGGNDVQKGPGGQTVVRAGDKDVMAYHYYDSGNNGAVTLGMKYLNWTSNGWPFLVELRQ